MSTYDNVHREAMQDPERREAEEDAREEARREAELDEQEGRYDR